MIGRFFAQQAERVRSLSALSKPCDIEFMSRPDVYDYIGLVLVAFVVALWVAHFALPAPPPDPSRLDNSAPQTRPLLPSR
jgi:hypothetical protein